MITRDIETLKACLSPDLVWTHSSGKSEGRDAVVQAIVSGAVVYHHIDLTESLIRPFGNLALHHGVIGGQVTKDGAQKPLRNRFLSVWQQSGERWVMVAWQSTGL